MNRPDFFKPVLLGIGVLPMLFHARAALADGNAIDKVYHPYIQPKEKEIEYRLTAQDDNNKELDDLLKHRFGFRYSPTDLFYVELYMLGEDQAGESFEISGYELETKIQLTEQGEYWADWGLLFELEKERDDSAWEFASSVLIEKEWGKWVGTANLSLEYEWGRDIKDELEGAVALQGRYRLSPFLEPAVEFYGGQDTLGIGPVVLGQLRLGPMKKLRWETGVIFGLYDQTPDQTVRVLLEFEF
ncbi:MAG: hypothetical protein ACU826_01390 [Gammaproteobacteria bacterium]